jgi:2OG-Fe(II) oxygenase superfamily
VYRRAADLLRIDEAYLRGRDKGEIPERDDYLSTLAEDLQLVNYKHRQEYTSHHDFGYSRIDRGAQGARYATLLLYLNEGMTGGETSFPRWVNAETFRELKVVPEGKLSFDCFKRLFYISHPCCHSGRSRESHFVLFAAAGWKLG